METGTAEPATEDLEEPHASHRHLPEWIREFSLRQDLYVSPAALEDISEQDLAVLEDSFGWQRDTGHFEVFRFLLEVNLFFKQREGELRSRRQKLRDGVPTEAESWVRVKDRESTGDWLEAAVLAEPVDPEYALLLRVHEVALRAPDISWEMKRLVPDGVPIGPLCVLTGKSFLIEARKSIVEHGLAGSRGILMQAEEDEARVRRLLGELQLLSKRGGTSPGTFFSELGDWIKYSGFLVEFEQAMDLAIDATRGRHGFYREMLSQSVAAPTAPRESRTRCTMRAFEATIGLIRDYSGLKKRAAPIVQSLFQLWGLDISLEAARKHRQRHRKT